MVRNWRVFGALVVVLGMLHPSTAGAYEVWVTNQAVNKVQILDGQSLKVLAEVPGADKPHNVTFSPDFKTAYVASVGSNDFTVIDAATRKPIKTVPAGKTAHHVAVAHVGGPSILGEDRHGRVLADLDGGEAL